VERKIAESQARNLKIDITQVVRKFWETVILKGLFESTEGKFLVFKGGTALRLVYGSPRFSEDLDFSLMADKLKVKFNPLINSQSAPSVSTGHSLWQAPFILACPGSSGKRTCESPGCIHH